MQPASNIGRFGDAPVGKLVGPGTRVFSLTLGRSFVTNGTSRIRFEMAFSNLFNIENLDVPSSMNINSSAFGRITATQTVDQGPTTTRRTSLASRGWSGSGSERSI